MTSTRFWRVYSDDIAAPEPTTLEREAADLRPTGGGRDRPAIIAQAADAMHAVRIAHAYALDCERTPTDADPRETTCTNIPTDGYPVPVLTLARADRASTPEERRAVLQRGLWFLQLRKDREARAAKRAAQAQPEPDASPIAATPT
jgi:hypothetical protein